MWKSFFPSIQEGTRPLRAAGSIAWLGEFESISKKQPMQSREVRDAG
jgi:hypothetical protein